MKKYLILSVSACTILAFLFAGKAPIHAAQDVNVSLKEVEPFLYCSVSHRGPYSQMAEAMDQLILQMQQQNINPSGQPFSIYHNSPEDTSVEQLEWELGFPIPDQLNPQEPLNRGEWRHTRVAAAVHTGPYENSGDTILAVFEWIEDNGLTPAGPILAWYLNLPMEVPASKLQTEIWVPVN
ncbi:MAG: GyrI-like domain-containing protein [Candidatus Aminicenantaceae bacterium]